MTTNASSVSNVTDTSSSERYTGRVKWFNNKAGYGFITVTDGPKAGSDIFVHHSSVKVDTDQYKYLVQGEYIEFALSHVTNGSHEFQAGEVSGIKGGKLMCETRRDVRTTRFQYQSVGKDATSQDVVVPRSVQPPKNTSVRPRGQGPRGQETREQRPQDNGGVWTPVKKPKQTTTRPAAIMKRTSSTAAATPATGGR
jgi:cold shock protein